MKRNVRSLATALAFAGVWFATAAAEARVDRFAVLIGNNRGAADETPLRYAESDAVRMYEALNQLGDFGALDMMLLQGQDAATVRSALIAMNERIRESTAQPDTQAVLVVYYSGHADSHALHLRDSTLSVAELRQLARGSAANFRLVVLDACRSGSLTRVKGGRRVAPFELNDLPHGVPNDGFAFLTASAANEDAQESDELRSAFFTHAFVSGLLGAADGDGDGAVVLDEAYRYAYEATLRATSRTFAGAQHPTFHYDLRGRGQLVLTRPRAHSASRSVLDFPSGLGFLVLRENSDGPVVVELERDAQSRRLSVPPGRYFVRARAPDVMYEGYLDTESGSTRAVKLAEFERIDYARLVRKRGGAAERAQGLEAGTSVRSTLPNASGACYGGFAGYAIDWSGVGARVRFSTCASGLSNRAIRADVLASDLALQLYRAWDIRWFTFELGVGAGLSLFNQNFETRGVAPDRLAAAPFVSLGLGAEANLSVGFYARLGVDAETHMLRVVARAGEDDSLQPSFAVRSTLGFGKRF
jgi:hypothetical protein